jgi:DNA ligase D-like protein (predicted 3'-phosphoesterase)
MADSKRNLEAYEQKRDMRSTPEPSDGQVELDWASERPVFVIQKHDASSLHYDFRIEAEGVLKSWAVPKGPSTDPSDRRFATPTEDHPLDYTDFEGVIPEDEYGGGTVLIWDRGSYRNLKDSDGKEDAESVSQQIDNGHLTIWLNGEKISGGYALIRTQQGDDERWLLIKMDDDEADARRNPVSTEPKSVKSGRTLEEIREQEGESNG